MAIDDGAQARAGNRHERDGQEYSGYGHQPVHHPHDDRVEDAEVTGHEANQEPDGHACECDGHTDQKRNSRPIKDARIHVATERIRAQPMGARHSPEALAWRDGERVGGAEKRRQECDQHDNDEGALARPEPVRS